MLAQLTRALRGKGFTQHVVSVGGRGPIADQVEAAGISVSTLNVRTVFDAPLGIRKLSSLIRELRPGIVQGWMYHGDLFAALAHRITSGRGSRRLFWNLRASNTDQGGYGYLIALGARLSAWPELVIANAEAGLNFHLARGYHPRATKIIPNGINTEKFRPDAAARSAVRAELGMADDAVVAIHVARVDPMKDHAMFLQAMQSLPNVRALLVGAGTGSLPLPGNVQALGLRRDVDRLYASADLVVSSSAFAEGFSNAIAEGMSAGLVPIATDVGDSRIIVGPVGRMVAPRDAAALAGAIAAEAERPPAERQARGLMARRRIEENFTLQKAVDAFATLYSGAA